MILSIILFFILILGLGATFISLFKLKSEDHFENIFLYICIGVGLLPFYLTMVHLLHIPLYIWLLCGLVWIVPILKIKSILKGFFRFNKSLIYIGIVLIIIGVFTGVYMKGAFSYPWLEDDDSWNHAGAANFISMEHTAWDDKYKTDFHYINPYPPAYDILMGTLHQTNDSVNSTLKLFNVLLIALGLLCFFFFARLFLESELKATIATFVLAMLPCFMSHFIWSQTIGIIVFFPALYCFERATVNKTWGWLGSICVASVLVGQPSCAVIFVPLLGIYALIRNWRFLKYAIIGGLFGSIYWVIMFVKYGFLKTLELIAFDISFITGVNHDTSGGLIYKIGDFLFPPLASKMDQPTGVGWVVLILVAVALVFYLIKFKYNTKAKWIIIAWLIITFLGVQGNALPFKLFPHRFWVFFAIPLALMAAEGLYLLANNKLRYLIISIFMVGILITSGYPKYVVETSMWPSGVILSYPKELQGWIDLTTVLPKDTHILQFGTYAQNIPVAFDMYTKSWGDDEAYIRDNIVNISWTELHSLLVKNQYEYLVIGYSSAMYLANTYPDFPVDAFFKQRFFELQNETGYIPMINADGLLLMKVT